SRIACRGREDPRRRFPNDGRRAANAGSRSQQSAARLAGKGSRRLHAAASELSARRSPDERSEIRDIGVGQTRQVTSYPAMANVEHNYRLTQTRMSLRSSGLLLL